MRAVLPVLLALGLLPLALQPADAGETAIPKGCNANKALNPCKFSCEAGDRLKVAASGDHWYNRVGGTAQCGGGQARCTGWGGCSKVGGTAAASATGDCYLQGGTSATCGASPGGNLGLGDEDVVGIEPDAPFDEDPLGGIVPL